MPQPLQIVIIKPSKYLPDGVVERFRRGFMPNSIVPYMRSMVPVEVDGLPVVILFLLLLGAFKERERS